MAKQADAAGPRKSSPDSVRFGAPQPDPGEDVLPPTDVEPSTKDRGQDVQPGTAKKGANWQSGRPDPDDPDDKLEKALEDSFPASDPPQPAQPGVTGWDAGDEVNKKTGGKA